MEDAATADNHHLNTKAPSIMMRVMCYGLLLGLLGSETPFKNAHRKILCSRVLECSVALEYAVSDQGCVIMRGY